MSVWELLAFMLGFMFGTWLFLHWRVIVDWTLVVLLSPLFILAMLIRLSPIIAKETWYLIKKNRRDRLKRRGNE